MTQKLSTDAVVTDKNHKSLLPERQMTQKECEEMDEREHDDEIFNFDGEFTLPSD